MKWTRATEKTIPQSSGVPIMLIVKWFEGEGDDERTLVRHMTANQLLDKVKGTWNYHYFLDETPTPESQWPTHIEIADKFVGIQMEYFDLTDFGVAVKLVEWLKEWLQTSGVREGTREARHIEAYKWYCKGVEDAGGCLGEGIWADFFDQYGDKFPEMKEL